MPEAASHDSAMQQHFLHQQQPNQQRLMLVVPTIHQATEKHEQHHQKVMDLKQAHCQTKGSDHFSVRREMAIIF